MSSSDWPVYRIKDISEIHDAKRVPLSSQEREHRQGNYPYYGASGIIDFIDDYIFDGEFVLISEDGENLRSRKTPIAFKATGKFWVNNHAHVLRGRNDFINDWIVYFFQNFDLNPFITGAVQPKLNRQNLELIEIPIPDDNEAIKITSILSALDEKIELNQQTNATLEAIAQAIFQEWFVRYNYPGAAGDLVESELGLIPAGWRVGTLGEVCENKRLTIHPNDIAPETAYVGLEHIPRKSLSLESWGVADDVSSQKTRFKKWDILFGKLRPYFHKVCIAPVDGICSTDILVIEPIAPDLFAFCLNYLFSDEVIAYVSVVADGTRMPRVNWQSIRDYQVIIPPDFLLAQFNNAVKPLYAKMLESSQQSTTITQIRDALLPKLMRGEIEV